MILKDKSVSLEGVSWRMFVAAVVAEAIWKKHGAAELVITSANDGKHKSGSLHYQGCALDFRIYNLPKRLWATVTRELQEALGDDLYDVVLEKDHVHCEFDPG